MIYKTCPVCGEVKPLNNEWSKMCDTCRKTRQKETYKKQMAKPKTDETIYKVCPECKKRKPYRNNRQVYCDECAKIRVAASRKKAYLKMLLANPNYPKEHEEKKKQTMLKPTLSIDEVLLLGKRYREQTGELLSYGQIVNKFKL